MLFGRLCQFLYPGCLSRIDIPGRKVVYLTFDDGPVPTQTPWVLDTLDRYGIKATFFMVGDNARRYPGLHAEVVARGHSVGNHTMHHLQGIKTGTQDYLDDVAVAQKYLESRLFRPPHALMRPGQFKALQKHYRVVMFDLITRDYNSNLTPDDIFRGTATQVRPGSIIVFHDSDKSALNMRGALPRVIEWLNENGYEFLTIPVD